MRYPKREVLESFRLSDGKEFTCWFYGENEGAAVITGPTPPPGSGMKQVSERCREDATDPEDARRKLRAWRREHGCT
jgi:hypothetical protein